jgi:hypothetical protein
MRRLTRRETTPHSLDPDQAFLPKKTHVVVCRRHEFGRGEGSLSCICDRGGTDHFPMKTPGPRAKDAAARRQVSRAPGRSVAASWLFSAFSGMATRVLTKVTANPIAASPELCPVSHRTAVRAELEISQLGGDSCRMCEVGIHSFVPGNLGRCSWSLSWWWAGGRRCGR